MGSAGSCSFLVTGILASYRLVVLLDRGLSLIGILLCELRYICLTVCDGDNIPCSAKEMYNPR
ncbi:hypothetical protein SAMN04489740_2267 [Arthrobacter alpinus]|uniref:Uncharacterized protein n=1 Tax=Arthrobacter alpinus TaxID=656366 RepID=A0A1H5L1T5_9MICC|nr:hypothetical protein SAMN04489740_2267 [Arthrobacter alpinus]